MSDHLETPRVVIVGAGAMGGEYAKVLAALGARFAIIGRGEESAKRLENTVRVPVFRGGLQSWLDQARELPERAIVATPVDALAATTLELLRAGVRHVLVEKPGGLSAPELAGVRDLAQSKQASVLIAYNRRFYASVSRARKIIEEDGGVSSFNFEFTEWSQVIAGLERPAAVKERWFFANSTHVVDLAFFMGGWPASISCWVAGALPWHRAAARFAGAGRSASGALFSYQANWEAPGRWSVEMLTRRHRLILRPLEQLWVQKPGSLAAEQIELDAELDARFKPGLYRQVEAFLADKERNSFLEVSAQLEHWTNVYSRMLADNL